MNKDKEKYTLTDSIIKIKTEPVQHSEKIKKNTQKNNLKDRISLNIDRDLKTELQLYCVKNKTAMTDVIENLIHEFLKTGSK